MTVIGTQALPHVRPQARECGEMRECERALVGGEGRKAAVLAVGRTGRRRRQGDCDDSGGGWVGGDENKKSNQR